MSANPKNIEKISKMVDTVQNLYYTTVLDGLSALGNAAIAFASKHHEFLNDLYNTQDSYGFAIWYKGKMVVKPTFYGEQMATEGIRGNWNTPGIEGEFGRDRARKILEEYNPDTNGWEMLVTTGTPYSYRLENLFSLDVLTGAFQFTENNWDKYFKKTKIKK